MQALKKNNQALETQLHKDQEGKEYRQHKAAQLQIVLDVKRPYALWCWWVNIY